MGPLTIYSYGLMVALGFCIAAIFIYRRAGEFGLDKEKTLDLFILILLFGILGARVFYVLLNLKYYSANPVEIVNLSKGGLVWYGGLFGGLIAAVIYAKIKKIDILLATDLAAPYIALAQSLGRIGCFLNGCCYGMAAPAGYMLVVCFPGDTAVRHPSQLYSSIGLLAMFVILRFWQDRRRFAGEIFLGYIMLYSLKRFFIEFVRGDSARLSLGLTIFQYISVAVFLITAMIFLSKAIKWKKAASSSR